MTGNHLCPVPQLSHGASRGCDVFTHACIRFVFDRIADHPTTRLPDLLLQAWTVRRQGFGTTGGVNEGRLTTSFSVSVPANSMHAAKHAVHESRPARLPQGRRALVSHAQFFGTFSLPWPGLDVLTSSGDFWARRVSSCTAISIRRVRVKGSSVTGALVRRAWRMPSSTRTSA